MQVYKQNSAVFNIIIQMRRLEQALAYLLCLFCLQRSVLCDSNQIINQIDGLTQQKQGLALEKNNLYNSLDLRKSSLDSAYANLIGTKSAALDMYRIFYPEHSKCQGLKPDIGLIGNVSSVSDTTCLLPPLSSEALSTYLSQLKFNFLKGKTARALKYVQDQQRFNNDVINQLTFFFNVRRATFWFQSLAHKLWFICLNDHNATNNPQLPACAHYKAYFDYFSILFENDVNQEFNYARSTQGPNQDLFLKNKAYQQLSAQLGSANTTLEAQKNALSTKYQECKYNLFGNEGVMDQRFSSALDAQSTIDFYFEQFNETYSQLDNLISKAKSDTTKMQTLKTSLKQSYS